MLNIAAFTFNYDQIEDRILLVGNLSNNQPRIDFWLTRKLVLRLLDAAQQLVEVTSNTISDAPAQHKADLAQFHHDNAQQVLNVEREDQRVAPSEPQLLSRLDFSHTQGKYRLLFFSGGEQPLAISILSYDELHQIFHLLHRGAQALDWGAKEHLFSSATGSSTVIQ